MFVDWSAECSADDPVLVVPWEDPSGKSAFVDLRANPYDFDRISETDQHLPLLELLRVLNASRSPVFTAKCDVWTLEEEELEHLHVSLALLHRPDSGLGSYVDILWREPAKFRSFPWHEQQMEKLVRLAPRTNTDLSAVEFVLRPALLDFDTPTEGYAVTIYTRAVGDESTSATQCWADTLGAIASLIRRSA